MTALLRRLAKSLVPESLRRNRSLRRAARDLYGAYYARKVRAILPTVLATDETHNFTYDLTARNLRYLAEMIAITTHASPAEIETYINEAINDRELKDHVLENAGPHRDLNSPFGRRLGWYAVARKIKPSVIVETGVERGHGAVLLCSALLRNAAEGRPGRYYGTDLDPNAGRLFTGKYSATGKILYGDSLQSLNALNETIDLFINDSDHSADYEYREYQAIAGKLSPTGIIVADNAHVTDRLALFSRERGRHFLYLAEEPENHWYPGAGLGVSFP